MKNIHTNPRSGMILMLMLAMMSLFAILIVGFMVVSSMANRQADSYQKKGRIQSHTSFAAAQEDTDAAVHTLLVGSTNPYSVIGPHSILENLYGHPGDNGDDWLKGEVVDTTNGPRIGTKRLEIEFDVDTTAPGDDAEFWQQVSMIGNVLAFQNANDRWESRRIVEVNVASNKKIYVDVIMESSSSGVTEVYINAAPYSGEGVLGSLFESTPNPTDPDYQTELEGLWLLNPDYTAPDVANMFLAWRYNATDSIPSFHRPSLFPAADERKVSLRPLGKYDTPSDHPDFDGSNPAYSAAAGPWDVDNDRDGEMDSVWVYTGMPARRSKDGKTYIPLVAYLVRDLDGRVNLNVAGNTTQDVDNGWSSPPPPTFYDFVKDYLPGATTPARGSGYGPAEIFIDPILPTTSTFTVKELLEGDASLGLLGRNVDVLTGNILIGGATVDDLHFFGYLQSPGVFANGIYGGRTPDFWGRDAVGFDVTGNRMNFPRNWSAAGWNAINVYTDNPYLFDPYHQTPYSQPFTLTEFETLLRPYDGDSLSLPQRLQHLFFGDSGSTGANPVVVSDVRNITVISSDIPSPNRRMRGAAGIYSLIYRCALAENGGIAATASTVTEDLMARLPEGIRQGLRIDLNQLVKSPNWSGGDHLAGLQARAEYAQGIYILLMAMCYDQLQGGYTEGLLTEELIKTRLAQWAVNIIDFADPDAVMTPMLFDINPFDGVWNPAAGSHPNDITVANLGTAGINLVWGMERPDLVLTETMAFHNRNVANTSVGNITLTATSTNSMTDDGDFDQVGPPQGSAFFELYCTASPNQPYYPQELYTLDGELDITRSVGGGYPVWRIVIGESTDPLGSSSNADADPQNSIVQRMQDAEFSFQPEQYRDGPVAAPTDPLKRSSVLGQSGTATSHEIPIDRIVSFALKNTSVNDAERTFWNDGSGSVLPLRPSDPTSYLIVAPREVTNLGSNDRTAPGVSGFGEPSGVGIDFSGAFINPANVMYCQGANGVELNISEPLLTADRTSYSSASAGSAAAPVDDLADDASGCPIGDDGLKGEGTVPFYKSAFLQRVADPRRAYDPVNNPYITVDWSMIDLTVFRGEKQETTPLTEPGQTLDTAAYPFYVSSRQWGKNALPVIPDRANPWARAINTTATAGGLTAVAESIDPLFDKATFKYLPEHTLGIRNDFDAGGSGSNPASFIHLPWNNAPFANPLEVMQVPASAPGRFGVEFVDTGTATMSLAEGKSMGTEGRFGADATAATRIGHLLNFFAVDIPAVPPVLAEPSLNLAEFLEFLTVPSRFVGTQHYLDEGDATQSVSLYREPGKINLNTVPPMLDASGLIITSPVWDALKGDRQGPDYDELDDARQGTGDFETPFRSASGKAASMLRINTSNEPVLEFGDPAAPNRLNTYNELEGLQRLSSMTTNRSNVFAVWVTVGYFEAIPHPGGPAGVYPQDYEFGKELGYESGEVVRHRAFYIIDRTIPVGFRRGELRNADDTILLKRVLE